MSYLNDYHGAVLGTSSFHPGEGIVLEDRLAVFATINPTGELVFYDELPPDSLATVFFCKSTGDYGITPSQKRTVFLESGQPLGPNRTYYFPRQTRLYIKERKNTFILG